MAEPTISVGFAVLITLTSSLIVGLVTKAVNDKNQRLKYVTEERAKWRNAVKKKAAKIYASENDSNIQALIAELQMNLNPYPENEDSTIIHYLKLIEQYPKDKEWKEQFILHISYMLKHDWERSKRETGTWFEKIVLPHKRRRYPIDDRLHIRRLKEMKRKIVRGIPNVSFTPLAEMGLENVKILRVWTILDEKKMFEGDKFDTQTGEKIAIPVNRTLDNPLLQHGVTVFLEDKVHDWNIYGDKFKFYSRIVENSKKVNLLIEYEEIK